jgi:hypothetical protein
MTEDNLTKYFKEIYSDEKSKIKLLRNVNLHVSICIFQPITVAAWYKA